jgi:hypothetical protein
MVTPRLLTLDHLVTTLSLPNHLCLFESATKLEQTLCEQFFQLYHGENMLISDISLHLNLFLLRAHQSLILDAACLTEKQLQPILLS